MAENGMLIANGTDLEKILEVSYISNTSSELLSLACETSNEATFSQQLDSFQYAIFGASNWKDRLRDRHNRVTHYKEFLAVKRGGCTQPRRLQCSCRECSNHRGYTNRPSCLLRFIRNLHVHAPEKMINNPRGFLKTNLFRNTYRDKRYFVRYFMKKFPNLFHILAALRQKQIDWFDWSGSGVPDQVVEGLTSALDYERDHGAVIQKFQCNQFYGRRKCELEVIASHGALVSRNMGKVLRVQATTLTVHHKPDEILTYSINNAGSKPFIVVFGLEQLNKINLSSGKVILLTSLYEKVEDVSKALKNLGEFQQVLLKWDDISKEAQERIRTKGSFLVQKQTYPASRFNLEKLSGVHLNKLLESESLELFETDNVDPEYVKRFLTSTTFKGVVRDDAVNFIKKWDFNGRRKQQQDLLRTVEVKLVFITGGPGEGKTTLLKHLHRSLNIPENVVLLMSANDLLSKYDSDLPGIQAVSQCFGFNDFEKEVIEKLQVVLLVDALDEAKSDTTQLINGLLKMDNLRIVVSVRNHLESKLTSKFQSAKFCPLAKLEEEDQVSIFLSTWKNLVGYSCEATAKELVSTYRKALNLTPLMCHMIAEVYVDPKNNIPSDTDHSELKIYELIVEKNFRRYLIEKKKVPEENVDDDIYQKLFMDYIRAHALLAIKCVLGSHHELCQYFNICKSEDEVELTPGQGLLESLEPPIFVHWTFVEFLLAWWVFMVLTGKIKIIETYMPAFREMFQKRYVYGFLGDRFLEMMVKLHEDPVLFNFQTRDLGLKLIWKFCWGRVFPHIFKTWVCSLKHYSAEEFEKEIFRISESCSRYQVRPYVGRDAKATELTGVKKFKISDDCIIRWVGLGERPSELLKTFPEGFYLRHPNIEKDPSDGTKIELGMYYVPEESPYAKDDMTIVGTWVSLLEQFKLT